MPRLFVAGALALSALILATPLIAAESSGTTAWPWKAKPTLDPALSLLTRVDDVSVKTGKEPPTVTITVKATAPAAGFTEPQLTHRLGDPNDLKFEFDARGRPPQDVKDQNPSPVTIEASYSDAPLAKLKVIEIYAKDNCIGISVSDGSKTPCTPKASVPPQ